MLFKTSTLVVNQDKRGVGRVPISVARELVNTRAAKVIHNRPAILELIPGTKPVDRPNKPVTQPKINALKNIVDMAGKFTGNKRGPGIMVNILLKIKDGKLYVEATDLESHFSGHIEAGNKYRFSRDEGVTSLCVSPERLKKYLAHTEGVVDIHIHKKDDVFGLKIGEFFLEGEDADRFPVTPQYRGVAHTVTNIANKLGFVSEALSTTQAGHLFSGICFDFKHNTIVGTDGSRMHLTPLSENTKQGQIDGFTIVPPGIVAVSKYLSGNVELVEDAKKENQKTVFDLSIPGCIQCRATYMSIEGRYPDYLDVIPKNNKNTFTTKTEDVIPTLKKAQVFYTEGNERVMSVTLDDTGVKLSTNGYTNPAYNTTLNGQYTGFKHKEVISIDFLLDCVQGLPPGEVEINIADEDDKGWIIKGRQGFTAVIMPVEQD